MFEWSLVHTEVNFPHAMSLCMCAYSYFTLLWHAIHAGNKKSIPQVMRMVLFYFWTLFLQTRDACTLDKFSNFFFKFPTIQGQPHMPQICFNTVVQFCTLYALRIIYVTAFYSTASVRLGMGHCFVKLGKLDKARYKGLWIRFLIKKQGFDGEDTYM